MGHPLSRTSFIVALAAAILFACSAHGSSKDVSDSAKKKYSPVSAEELLATVPGHFIDERPYPCDAGPLLINKDGTFIQANGWGSAYGHFVVSKGRITLNGMRGNMLGSDAHYKIELHFVKDRSGKLYVRMPENREFWPLVLSPIDENTLGISCDD